MVIDDLDVFRRAVAPTETDPTLVVDPDTVLTLPVTAQRFEPVPRHRRHVFQQSRVIQHPKLASCHILNIAESPALLALKELLSLLAAERSDHTGSISRIPLNEIPSTSTSWTFPQSPLLSLKHIFPVPSILNHLQTTRPKTAKSISYK